MRLVAISYDSVEVLSDFAERGNISYSLLSDSDNKVMEAYDLLNETRRAKIAHPATILIGQDGIVKSKLFEDGYRTRHSPLELTEAAEKLK